MEILVFECIFKFLIVIYSKTLYQLYRRTVSSDTKGGGSDVEGNVAGLF
jgi:hypothetical protein